jgi:predicted metal-dependent hydrolase
MTCTVEIKGQNIFFELQKHPRSRRMRIHIRADGSVLVTIPKRSSVRSAERFVKKSGPWILQKQELFKERNVRSPAQRRAEYVQHKESAREFLLKKVDEMNAFYGFSYGKIAVRDQRTRWGSCSSKGNLNFHYKLLFLPETLAEYVVVHELCHLKELNHSSHFWELVEQQVPDYKEKRKALRKQDLF